MAFRAGGDLTKWEKSHLNNMNVILMQISRIGFKDWYNFISANMFF